MKRLLRSLIPKAVLQRHYDNIEQKRTEARSSAEQRLPRPLIGNRHIGNCKLLVSREDLLEKLPKGGTVAELGVDQGDFSESILRISHPQKLHLVDNWGSERYDSRLYGAVKSRFAAQLAAGSIEIHRSLSTDCAGDFANGYFDWIYIDTDHSYETTKSELELYRCKIKDTGFIAGHDYVKGNWVRGLRYGVIEAVHEFCVKYDWELVYLTCVLSEWDSFAIRKIHE